VLLGASRVIAVDNDPQAITASIENGKRNHIAQGVIETYLPDQLPDDYAAIRADILVANILAEPLLQLAENFSCLVPMKGSIVLSGILAEQSSALLEHYSSWFDMGEAVLSEEWARLTGSKKN